MLGIDLNQRIVTQLNVSVSWSSFVDPIYYLCFVLVFVILLFLFLAVLWSPVEKGLTSWLSCV